MELVYVKDVYLVFFYLAVKELIADKAQTFSI